ncbi:MAG: hypothetical protein K0R27_3971 [Xanthobacteraceae bacterium]|jgi:hypothetical protein|nr:hypothetical protein [Xanthobacteraceae bacterium]
MSTETYRIVGVEGDWRVLHQVDSGTETTSMAYATKEAAFEAAVLAASNAVKDGSDVSIRVPAPRGGEAALGGDN